MRRFGHRVVHVPETGSTNDDLRDLAAGGADQGTVVRADRQTAGRGRLGRAWASPAGGLWFSLLLRPRAAPDRWPLIPLVMGSAVAATFRDLGAEAAVKWPNDVLVEGRKVAGLLVESRFAGDASFAIVGVGINANVPPGDLPQDARPTAGTLIEALGKPLDLDGLLARLLDAMEARFERFERGEHTALVDEARRLSWTLGRPVEASGVAGVARDLRADDGALVIEAPDGNLYAVLAGDARS